MEKIYEELRIIRTKLSLYEREIVTEKKRTPMGLLERIVQDTRKKLSEEYPKRFSHEKLYDAQRVDMLEPIIRILKDFDDRLQMLERKTEV
jgi:hypothetical protein